MTRAKFVHVPELHPPSEPRPEMDPSVRRSLDRFFSDYGPEGINAETRLFERFEKVFVDGSIFSAGLPFDTGLGESYSWIDRVDLPTARQALRRAAELLGESFKLNMVLFDAAIGREAEVRRETGRIAAKRRVANSPKSAVMARIQAEWLSRRQQGIRVRPKDFAHEMNTRFAGAVTVESIRNAMTKWAKAFHPGT